VAGGRVLIQYEQLPEEFLILAGAICWRSPDIFRELLIWGILDMGVAISLGNHEPGSELFHGGILILVEATPCMNLDSSGGNPFKES
jgi:hypothetical protein